MLENIPPYAIPIVTFLLGYIIANLFKSGKIKTLRSQLEEKDRKFFELQSDGKRQLAEKNNKINTLTGEVAKLKASPADSSKSEQEIRVLKNRNKSLESELNRVSAKLKETKVEQAVSKVDRKYPIEKYGISDTALEISEASPQSDKSEIIKTKKLTSLKGKGSKPKKSGKKDKSKQESKIKKSRKGSLKSKKKKKKLKSKKRKAGKTLDLRFEDNATKRGLKIKKKKKRKAK